MTLIPMYEVSINVVLPAFPEDNGTRLDSFQHQLPKATRSKITGYTRKDLWYVYSFFTPIIHINSLLHMSPPKYCCTKILCIRMW